MKYIEVSVGNHRLNVEVEVVEEVSHFGRNDLRIKPTAGDGTAVVAKHKVKEKEDE